MSGHKRIEEITQSLVGIGKMSFSMLIVKIIFCLLLKQVAYEHNLVDWALRLGNVYGSLENAYQETMFNPARYCAYMERLECAKNIVEV